MSCTAAAVPAGQKLRQLGLSETLDWTWDWRNWLAKSGNDTFAAATDPVVFSDDDSIVAGAAIIDDDGLVSSFLTWPEDTVKGSIGQVTCRIVTTGGRTKDWTFYFEAV